MRQIFKEFITLRTKYHHVECISEILEKEPAILLAYLFGSFAKGTQSEHSDLDIAVYLTDPALLEKDPLYPSRIAIKIEKMLPEKKSVDLRVLNGSTIRFKAQVIMYGKLLHSKDEKQRIEFETSSLAQYYDFKPYLKTYDLARKVRLGI